MIALVWRLFWRGLLGFPPRHRHLWEVYDRLAFHGRMVYVLRCPDCCNITHYTVP